MARSGLKKVKLKSIADEAEATAWEYSEKIAASVDSELYIAMQEAALALRKLRKAAIIEISLINFEEGRQRDSQV